MQKFLQKIEIQKSIFGRKQTNFGRYVAGRSSQSKILPEIFFIENGQKLVILSQKNIPPPPKTAPFGGGFRRSLSFGHKVSWAEKSALQARERVKNVAKKNLEAWRYF